MDDWDNMAEPPFMGYTTATVPNVSVPPATDTYSVPTSTMIMGKMITVNNEIATQTWLTVDHEDVKRSMIAKIVGELIKNKMVEFTYQQDPVNDKVLIRARLFVTPDDQVRILRKGGLGG